MPPRSERHRLQDIVDAIDRIDSYTAGNLRSALEDRVIRDAVLYNLMIVGEAAKHVSSGLKGRATGVNWSGAAGLRDKLTHDYFGTDIKVVKALDRELSAMKSGVERLLGELGA